MEGSRSDWKLLIARGVQEDVLFRNMVSLSALSWLVYECIATFQDEYTANWRGSTSSVRALYLFGRYVGLAMQIANIYLVLGPLSNTPVPREMCLSWFIYLASSSVALLIALEMVLMARVHVLYDGQTKVGAFFVLLLTIQVVTVYAYCQKSLPLVAFSSTCDVLSCPHSAIIIMAAVMVTQAIVLCMALKKRSLASNTSSIVHLIVREGAWVFALIISLWVTIVPYSLFLRTSKPHLIFPWPMSVMSITICRLILNLKKAPRPKNVLNMTTAELQLASVFYVSESETIDPIEFSNTLELPVSPTSDSL